MFLVSWDRKFCYQSKFDKCFDALSIILALQWISSLFTFQEGAICEIWL